MIQSMHAFKNCRFAMIFLVMVCLGIGLLVCVTTSQIQALEEKAQQALEKAEKEGQSAEAAAKKCEALSASPQGNG